MSFKYEALTDKGSTRLGISEFETHCMIFFENRIAWMQLPKGEAINLAKCLLRQADRDLFEALQKEIDIREKVARQEKFGLIA
jgi:hypothetical protein